MKRYITKAGEYLGKGLDRVYEPVCRRINGVMEAKAALAVGVGLELAGIGQILHSAAVSHNSLEIALGSVFVAGGSLFLGAGYKYLHGFESQSLNKPK